MDPPPCDQCCLPPLPLLRGWDSVCPAPSKGVGMLVLLAMLMECARGSPPALPPLPLRLRMLRGVEGSPAVRVTAHQHTQQQQGINMMCTLAT